VSLLVGNIYQRTYQTPFMRERELDSLPNLSLVLSKYSLFLPTVDQINVSLENSHRVYAQGNGIWSSPAALPLRFSALMKLAGLLHEQAPKLAELETKQTGRCIREMTAQLARVGEWFEYFASLIRVQEDHLVKVKGEIRNEVKRVPLGVVVQCTPWNHPLLIAVKKIAPALAAGNSVILKGSELTPLTVLEPAALAKEAGIPDHVLQVLPGRGSTTGMQLITSPLVRKIDLTGSSE
jgi:acyl-CoA reductase-like NAD-dependent aldehyde dehydrogenase